MSITPYDHGRFLVSSRSRVDLTHLVDLSHQDEPWRKPHPMCSCESNFIHGRICPHILATVEHEKLRLGL